MQYLKKFATDHSNFFTKMKLAPRPRKLHLRFSRSIFLILNFVQGRGVYLARPTFKNFLTSNYPLQNLIKPPIWNTRHLLFWTPLKILLFVNSILILVAYQTPACFAILTHVRKCMYVQSCEMCFLLKAKLVL